MIDVNLALHKSRRRGTVAPEATVFMGFCGVDDVDVAAGSQRATPVFADRRCGRRRRPGSSRQQNGCESSAEFGVLGKTISINNSSICPSIAVPSDVPSPSPKSRRSCALARPGAAGRTKMHSCAYGLSVRRIARELMRRQDDWRLSQASAVRSSRRRSATVTPTGNAMLREDGRGAGHRRSSNGFPAGGADGQTDHN